MKAKDFIQTFRTTPTLTLSNAMRLLHFCTLALMGMSKPLGTTNMRNLVSFGDSFTDEARRNYFVEHGGEAPPPGVMLPPTNDTASGGQVWGRFVAKRTGAEYYNYAVGGAACSNEINPRWADSLDRLDPSVLEYEVPAFLDDIVVDDLYPDRHSNNTMSTVWIGTNDLGAQGFLTNSQVGNKTLLDYVDCVWKVFDSVYQVGGRHIALLNVPPLWKLPLYRPPRMGGTGNSIFWRNKTAYAMADHWKKTRRQTTAVNTMFEDYLARQAADRWPGSSLYLVNVNQLLQDISERPDSLLSPPSNSSGYFHVCSVTAGTCQDSPEPKDSFMWYDELHPSERASEIMADSFIDVVNGVSKYGLYVES